MSITNTINICIVSFLMLLQGCQATKKKSNFPDSDRYNFSSPKVVNLPHELDEISGIAYYPKDTSVFAIIDEDGILYKIPLNNPHNFRSWAFDKKRDYEDVVLKDSIFYVLVSNGDMVTIQFNGDQLSANNINLSGDSKKVNEYESLYIDSGKMIMICKKCETDAKNALSSFMINLTDSTQSLLPYQTLDFSSVFPDKSKHLKPSAAAINPITNELYIISSIEKLLVIADRNGAIRTTYKLDPVLYKQPEGIAFTPEGDLIISNEFAEVGDATLLLIKNKIK